MILITQLSTKAKALTSKRFQGIFGRWGLSYRINHHSNIGFSVIRFNFYKCVDKYGIRFKSGASSNRLERPLHSPMSTQTLCRQLCTHI